MKNKIRVLNIWFHGKLKLCKTIKRKQLWNRFFFAYYGKNPKNEQEIRDLYVKRVNEVLGFTIQKNILNEK